MSVDETTWLIGVLPDASLNCKVTLYNLQKILVEGLGLRVFFDPLVKALDLNSKKEVSLNELGDFLNSTAFLKLSSNLVENRDTTTNVRLIKTALFLHSIGKITADKIRTALTCYTVIEREHLGVPLNPQVLIKGLRHVNLFMPRRLVEAWLQHCVPVFEGESGLTHWEFLFFICNAQDRADMIEKKIPHGKFRLDKDKQMETYNFDIGLKHSRAPDSWLQELTNPGIDAQKIMFEYESNPKSSTVKRRKNRRYSTRTLKETAGVSNYRKLLRDPNLYREIKGRVSESNSFVILAKQLKPKRTSLKSKLSTPGLEKLVDSRPRSKAELKRLHTSVGPDCGHRINKSRPISAGRAQSLMSSNHSYIWEAAIEFAIKNEEIKQKLLRPYSAKTNATSATKSSRPRVSRPFNAHSITSMSGLDIPVREEPFKVLNLRETTSLNMKESARLAESYMGRKTPQAL
mmetsp:Transcript_32105/g.55392  ORF Transcript_32105/g.55392 Transcript_32105/m.55392 type:complete len:460 (+) Transcript_32105:735-2114(+)